jgi:hypothetical protein
MSEYDKKSLLKEYYTQEDLEQLFEALELDTDKYTFEYLAEELGFESKEENWEKEASELLKDQKINPETGEGEEDVMPTEEEMEGAAYYSSNYNESYTREDLEQLFEALELDTEKYTFEYLAEELGFEPEGEMEEAPAMVAVQPEPDQGEYDEEGSMAKLQIHTIADASAELYNMLGDNDNLPEWVQSKITLAKEYIDTARDYMKSQSMEQAQQTELVPAEELQEATKEIKKIAKEFMKPHGFAISTPKAREAGLSQKEIQRTNAYLAGKNAGILKSQGVAGDVYKQNEELGSHNSETEIKRGKVLKSLAIQERYVLKRPVGRPSEKSKMLDAKGSSEINSKGEVVYTKSK